MVVGLSSGRILELGSNLFTPSLAQIVNVGFGPAGILGLAVAVSGAALYFLRSVRPELARDQDIFFAAVGLLCGGILFFQGWRLDPILLFGQLLLTGSTVFFAVESIRLRQVATVQAKRNAPIFEEEERPVSRRDVYAELDEFGAAYEEPPTPRIRGTRDGTSARRSNYLDEWAGESSPPRSSRSASRGEFSSERPPRKRRPSRPTSSGRQPAPPSYGGSNSADVDVTKADIRGRPGDSERGSYSRSDKGRTANPSKSRKKRPRPDSPTPAQPDDYVDYQPIDYTDYTRQERDNSANFDDDDENT